MMCCFYRMIRTMTFILAVALPVSLVADPANRLQLSVTPRFVEKRLLKVENNSIITFLAQSTNKDEDQIEVFARSGKKILSLNPFRSMEGAVGITLWDVSVGSTGLVAVAGVYANPSKRPAMALLTYSREGQLLRAYYIPPERSILKLEVDADESIWALGGGSDEKAPATVAMITKYDKRGNVLKDFLPRSDFPMDAKETGEGPDIGGQVSFGLTNERVWFWLPRPRQLVTLRKDGSDVQKFITGLPTWPGSDTPRDKVIAEAARASWLPSGEFLAEVIHKSQSLNKVGLHLWDPASDAWKLIPTDMTNSGVGRLWAVDQDQMVFVYRWAKRGETLFEIGWEPIRTY